MTQLKSYCRLHCTPSHSVCLFSVALHYVNETICLFLDADMMTDVEVTESRKSAADALSASAEKNEMKQSNLHIIV